jgi:glucan biosynthesis protein C
MEKPYVGKGIGSTGINSRIYFLDNLKAAIILLLIAYHVAMGYTTWKLSWWWVNDIEQNPLFDFFVLTTSVYIMPIMFFIAGYFSLPVLLKKGIGGLWRDKTKRIVLPWLGGWFFLAPITVYFNIISNTSTPPDYFTFWISLFSSEYYLQNHYWFLGVLTLFFLFFTACYTLRPQYFKKAPKVKNPSNKFLVGFTLLTAACFFIPYLFISADYWVSNPKYIVTFQPTRIGIYLCYFGLGIYAWKNAWFTRDGYRPNLYKWVPAGIIMFFGFLIYRVLFTLKPDVPILFKAGHTLAYAVFCVTFSFALIAVFERFLNSNAYLWRRLSANSYIIYFIHFHVFLPIAYAVQKVECNIWMKYIGVFVAGGILSFLVSEYVISPVLALGKGRCGETLSQPEIPIVK